MAIAPQVYQFNQQLAQGRNPFDQAADFVGSTISNVGKAAIGLGLLTGAGLLASKGYKTYGERKAASEPTAKQTTEETAPAPAPAPAPATTPGAEPEDIVKVTQIEMPGRGVSSQDIVQAIQAAKSRTSAERRASRLVDAPSFGDTSEISPKDLELYAQHTQAMHQRSVSERAQQFLNRLGLDDEVEVDNDIIASNPLSNTALASQDITSADPASAIGQRINTNQTGAAAEVRAMAETPATVASKLATQQSPVHVKEEGTELVGAPAAGAAEAFRKGREYQAMKEQYSALRDIASPTTEGVSSADVLSAVPTKAPVAVVSAQPRPSVSSEATQGRVSPASTGAPYPQHIQEIMSGLRRAFAGKSEQDLYDLAVQVHAKKTAAPAAVVEEAAVVKPAAPQPVAFLKEKAAGVMPEATQRGTVEHQVAEAMERLEGERGPLPKGTISYGQPYKDSATMGVRLYPTGQVGWLFKDPYGKGTTEYGHTVDPDFMPYLKEGLERGDISTADYNKLKAMGVLSSTVGYNP